MFLSAAQTAFTQKEKTPSTPDPDIENLREKDLGIISTASKESAQRLMGLHPGSNPEEIPYTEKLAALTIAMDGHEKHLPPSTVTAIGNAIMTIDEIRAGRTPNLRELKFLNDLFPLIKKIAEKEYKETLLQKTGFKTIIDMAKELATDGKEVKSFCQTTVENLMEYRITLGNGASPSPNIT